METSQSLPHLKIKLISISSNHVHIHFHIYVKDILQFIFLGLGLLHKHISDWNFEKTKE